MLRKTDGPESADRRELRGWPRSRLREAKPDATYGERWVESRTRRVQRSQELEGMADEIPEAKVEGA